MVSYYSDHHKTKAPERRWLGWNPCLATSSTLSHPILSWLRKGVDGLELAANGPAEILYWSRLEFVNGALAEVKTSAYEAIEPYRAVGLIRAGRVAAVTGSEVQWLHQTGDRFKQICSTKICLPNTIACLPNHLNNDLILIGSDGAIARVPLVR
jgi:hypothetical protein